MAIPEEEADAPAPVKKPSGLRGIVKWVLISLGVFTLVTVSQAIAPLFTLPLMTKLAERKVAIEAEAVAASAHKEEDAHKAEKLADPLYIPLNPPMIVNFSNDPSGFMQVEVQVMARDKSIIDAVKTNEPAIRNALLMLFGGKVRNDVTTREGKEALRTEVLAEVQKVLAPYTAPDNVEEVYFTSLIAQ